jgi:hypothetical protein
VCVCVCVCVCVNSYVVNNEFASFGCFHCGRICLYTTNYEFRFWSMHTLKQHLMPLKSIEVCRRSCIQSVYNKVRLFISS